MTRVLYYDVFAGISGDMNLGALVDLGVDSDYLQGELGKLHIEGFRLEVKRDMRKGISGTKVTVVIDNPENEKHRHLRHIEDLINKSSLSAAVKQKSLAIFMKVAEAEAKVHGIDIQKVHFHEVGALDSIADIVGAAICQEYLEVDEIQSSPLQLGGGFVKCAHGMMPVPAPATAEIVRDLPVRSGLVEYEATTPTGAAILAATVDVFTEGMDLTVEKTAYGIGQRDGEIPNVLRVYLASTVQEESDGLQKEVGLVLECNIDDMDAERFAHVQALLMEGGAADAWITPILMKKSRPAHMLSVLCHPELSERMKEILFRESSSIGLREYAVEKNMLSRETRVVQTPLGEVPVKVASFKGQVVSQKPEYETCRTLASQHGVSLEEVQKEVYKSL